MIKDINIFEKNKANYKEKDLSKKTYLENDDYIYKIKKFKY